jgi:hypothetical protein
MRVRGTTAEKGAKNGGGGVCKERRRSSRSLEREWKGIEPVEKKATL